jgi:hypothetical protein
LVSRPQSLRIHSHIFTDGLSTAHGASLRPLLGNGKVEKVDLAAGRRDAAAGALLC